MKDVTQTLNEYRECVRGLWNKHFLPQVSSEGGWDVFDEYDGICTKIFSSLVLAAIERISYDKSQTNQKSPKPLLFLRAIPIVEAGIPINIGREKGDGHYWDYPITIIKPTEADLRFIDFYDFDLLGFRDFHYCRVRIIQSNVNPDLIGRDALVLCNHIKIYFDEAA